MTVRREEGGAILLEGDCGVAEAEALLELLVAHPEAAIDWSRCRSAHAALLQVLLAAQRPVFGLPEDEFLRRWVAPAVVGWHSADGMAASQASERTGRDRAGSGS